MNTRYLTLFTTLAFLGYSISVFAAPPPKCEPWPQCKDDGGGGGGTSARYSAALTAGGFRFNAVDITPNKSGNGYTSTLPLGMGRPVTTSPPVGQIPWESGDDPMWDDVFLACYDVLGGVQIDGISVGSTWGITQGGRKKSKTSTNIRISFRDVVPDNFPGVDIDFALFSRSSFDRSAFFPKVGDTSVYPLDMAQIFGADNANHLGCNSGEFDMLLGTASLEISRIE